MRRTWTVVLALTALGGVLRFATLDRQSFWLDELVTVSLLDRGFGDMLDAVPESEATPYLYYVLAWLWTQAFGLGEAGLRSLSALAGTATVPVAYGAGAALVSRRAGLIAAALVSVHPFLVWYSQEARAYGLLTLFAACSLLFFGRALSTRARSSFAGFAVSSSLALATHYYAIFLVVPEIAWLVHRGRPRRAAVLSSLVPAAVLLLHLPLLLEQRGAGSAVAELSLAHRLAGIPKNLVVGYSFPAEIAGSLAAAGLVALGFVELGRRARPETRRRALVPGGLALLAVGVPSALAIAGVDYVVARNTVLAVVPAAIFLAAGYAASRLGLAAAAALAGLLFAIVVAVSVDERYGRTDWRGVAERLERASSARAIVVTPYMSRSLWRPYLPGLDEPGPEAPLVREIAVVGLASEGGFTGGAIRPPDPALPAAPPGFTLAVVERTPTYTLLLYRAPAPVPAGDLVALRLADIQPGILLQHPRP